MIIKILQWNIWYKEDPQNIVKLIKELQPDIACLQEVTTTSEFNPGVDIPQILSDAMDHADFNYKQAQIWRTEKVERSQGNIILSKLPITSSYHEYLQSETINPTDFSKEGRVYVAVTVDANGIPFTVGTVHLSYTHRFVESEAKEMEEMKLLELVSRKKERYLLTGDLNAPPDSSIINRLDAILKNCGPDFSEKTWTTKPFIEGDFKEDELNWRLDYAFSTWDVKIISAEIIKTDYSDHLPLLITVKI